MNKIGPREILVKHWMNRVRQWRKQDKPVSWELGKSEIHSSLLITLLLFSLMTFCLSYLEAGYSELRSAAITLPLIWLASLTVRVASQQLAIGRFSYESSTLIGPAGNLRTDYEYLPAKVVVAYGLAGQVASIGLMAIALVVHAAVYPETLGVLTVYDLIDFRGGWTSRAWATQIFWVNLLLIAVNCLPAVPFDGRALLYRLLRWFKPNGEDAALLRSLGLLNSHLAAMVLGIGLMLVLKDAPGEVDAIGWAAACLLASYLFIASQWDLRRAVELENQMVPMGTGFLTLNSGNSSKLRGPHFDPSEAVSDSLSFPGLETTGSEDDEALDLHSKSDPFVDGFGDEGSEAGTASDGEIYPGLGFSFDTEEIRSSTDGQAASGDPDVESKGFPLDEGDDSGGREVDIDELLRKVHRSGLDSLSDEEQRELLHASAAIKERRGSE